MGIFKKREVKPLPSWIEEEPDPNLPKWARSDVEVVKRETPKQPKAERQLLRVPSSNLGRLRPVIIKDEDDALIYTARTIMNIRSPFPGDASQVKVGKIKRAIGECPNKISDADADAILERIEERDFQTVPADMIDFVRGRGLSISYYSRPYDVIKGIQGTVNDDELIAFFMMCVHCNESGIFPKNKWSFYKEIEVNQGFIKSFDEFYRGRVWFFYDDPQLRSHVAYKRAREVVV